MFDDFTLETVPVGEVRLRVRHGGQGPPLLLLHGHPRTHMTWHHVADLLSDSFTVVCPDLRGYGLSSKPAETPGHGAYSKRAMAGDVVELMRMLGHDRFAVAGHDRGAYVAQRLALDHPAAVSRLVVLDGVPIGEALARSDARFASTWWHWFFLGQTEKPAEPLICADPLAWYQISDKHMGAAAYADLAAVLTNPETVHAMCEDYRAGLTVDRRADDADQAAGRRIACPVLFCYAAGDGHTTGEMVALYGDPGAIWRDWADDVRVATIDSGHHMAEEAPEQLASTLREFLLPTPAGM
ncbi:haloacetate dehalogenase [Allocatelliglobosispora scoriae]|uniref:Haloacetate dehalogenase n=1 Tax=Allocatelliglobosispora scoriae TaxID=643052 RepID=A0A841BKQ6_9ACTN|nr:alpha/beta hydrolase [Allocatelliglobosispora scoriae]MBB5868864.1 haloacetate dehalogenase [Allocatelliglobosispora scoriae]